MTTEFYRECDLCGLGCGKHPVQQRVGDEERYFCCIGCMNVYLILFESGVIAAGQDIRQTELFQRSLQLGLISKPDGDSAGQVNSSDPAPTQDLMLHISGMWCTSCAWLIEHSLTSLPGMVRAEASFASDLVKLQYHPQKLPPERIRQRIEALGYKVQPYLEESSAANAEQHDLLIRTGLAAFLWANVMSLSLVLYAGYFEQISTSVRRGLPFVLMMLATLVVFYCAQPILRLAWRGVWNGAIRMEALLALGILAAYGYSVVQTFRGEIHVYYDTATVIVTLVLTGKLIERGAKQKASRWIASLHGMLPRKVRLLVESGERFVNIAALEPGQTFMVKAGERIPADGTVAEGESHADESLLTGESSPVRKRSGESVVAGSINLDGVLKVRAARTASDSTLARIIALVEHALSSRSELERTVDRVSRVFVPCVILIAVLTFLFAWLAGAANFAQAVMRGITVLVIACPCALGMATPLAITAALGSASRRGILVRDSRVLETLPKVDAVILDKTGTVTEGKFSLLELTACEERCAVEANVGGRSALRVQPRTATRDEVLSVLASLERYSEHPLGSAVTAFARQTGAPTRDANSVEIHQGRGITGVVEGRHAFAGNRRLAKELGIWIEQEIEDQAQLRESAGETVSFLGWDGEVRGLASFGDRLKTEAVELATRLKDRGIAVHLVSGDSRATTEATAMRLGADSWEAEALPEEKAEMVRRLQKRGAVVAMVGDGINDAPALAQADLGIAMGSGTDIAMKAAAVVLMSGSVCKVLDILELAQRTMRIVRQNLFWAFFYNSIGITLAVAGILNPILAAVAMLLSSLSVVGNSTRLLRQKS
ncbi:MAG TPA: heavy metal translocating P-type ATPase [Terriglobales bacterium]|nr:heavy metal translocating P-type ATPase [Terriglobales bacterium]